MNKILLLLAILLLQGLPSAASDRNRIDPRASAASFTIPGELILTFKTEVTSFLPADPILQDVLRQYPLQGFQKLHPQFGSTESSFLETVQKFQGRFPQRQARATPADFKNLARMNRTVKISFADKTLPLPRVIEALQQSPVVETVEPNFIYRASENCPVDDPYACTVGSNGQPEQDLWGLHKIGAPSVWAETQGKDVVVAVIDSGIDLTHPDITQNVWVNSAEQNGAPGKDDDNNGYVDDLNGYDFENADKDPTDDHFHGTHVAGTIAAVGNNQIGIVGVAPQAKVMAVKVLDANGFGATGAIAKGITYATNAGADVINMSLGGSGSKALQDALQYAQGMGVIIVAAAGNESTDAANTFPGAYKETVAVAASKPDESLASFSNWGWQIDLAAPGTTTLSLKVSSLPGGFPEPNGPLLWLQGTSMAAPHVSGAIALLLGKYPKASVDQIKTALRSGTTDILNPGWDPISGYGRLNLPTTLATLPNACVASILKPTPNQLQQGGVLTLEYRVGPAMNNTPVSYTLKVGPGIQPQQWSDVLSSSKPFSEPKVLSLENVTTSMEGPQTLFLEVKDDKGQICATDRTTFSFSNRSIETVIFDKNYQDYFGTSLSTIGDLNKDGITDLVIGAPQADIPDSFYGNGKVFILRWKNGLKGEFPADHPFFYPNLSQPTILTGEQLGDAAGYRVSGEGDIDQDGLNDLLLSAPYFKCPNNLQVSCGKVYLILGKDLQGGSLNAVPTTTWLGAADDFLGTNLAWTDDLDGDGKNDFIMGGKSSLHFLASSQITLGAKNQVPPAFFIENPQKTLSFSITSDLTGDGLADLFVGIPKKSATLYSASPKLTSSATFSTEGESVDIGYSYGDAVLGRCDLDGVAPDDAAIVAGGFISNQIIIDRALYLYNGNDLKQSGGAKQKKSHLFPLGADSMNLQPSQLTCLPDVNGDGRDELAFSVLNESKTSRVFLALGKDNLSYESGVPEATASTFWLPPTTGKKGTLNFGISLMGVKDLNGDGTTDLVIGDSCQGGLCSGALFVSYGQGTTGQNGSGMSYSDNCPEIANPNQTDTDGDGVGDACEPPPDGDGDTIEDGKDNCPALTNTDQKDSPDKDGIGNVCDPDDDNDGVSDENDNCPLTSNSKQEDPNGNGIGYACDKSENPILQGNISILPKYKFDFKKWWDKFWPPKWWWK